MTLEDLPCELFLLSAVVLGPQMTRERLLAALEHHVGFGFVWAAHLVSPVGQ